MIHKNSSQYWIVKDVKDGVSCISYWQAGLGIVQCCNIVPSLLSSFGESWDSGIYFAPQLPRGFDHFYGAGRGGEPPPPHSAGRGGEPPLPRGEGSPRDGAPIPGNYMFVVTIFGCNLLFTSVFCLAWCSRFHIILAPDIWYLMSHNPIFSGPDRFVPGTRRKASAEKKQKLGLERKVLSTGRGGSRVCYFVISDCCVLWYIFWLTVE